MLVRLNGLIVFKKHLEFIVFWVQECHCLPILLLQLSSYLVGHQVLRMISTVLLLLDLILLCNKLSLLTSDEAWIIVVLWVQVFEVNGIYINIRNPIIVFLIVCDDSHIIEIWVTNLVCDTLLVTNLSIGIFFGNVDIVVEDFYPYSTSHAFL